MRVYVAGRVKNITEVNIIQNVVLERGHEITHDWTGVEGEVRDSWVDDPTKARQVATLDFLGTTQADGIILCGYGCDEGEGGLGCFIEAGLAMASGVPMIVLGPMRESVFWYAPFVLKVNYRIDHGITVERPSNVQTPSDEEIVKIEAVIAVNGLESLDRQKRLALSGTDTQINLQ